MQIVGMLGVIQTIRRTFAWALRLMFGKIDRLSPTAIKCDPHDQRRRRNSLPRNARKRRSLRDPRAVRLAVVESAV